MRKRSRHGTQAASIGSNSVGVGEFAPVTAGKSGFLFNTSSLAEAVFFDSNGAQFLLKIGKTSCACLVWSSSPWRRSQAFCCLDPFRSCCRVVGGRRFHSWPAGTTCVHGKRPGHAWSGWQPTKACNMNLARKSQVSMLQILGF